MKNKFDTFVYDGLLCVVDDRMAVMVSFPESEHYFATNKDEVNGPPVEIHPMNDEITELTTCSVEVHFKGPEVVGIEVRSYLGV